MNHNLPNSSTMHLGHIRVKVVSGGRFKMDGGTMFGLVPKTLWSRCAQPDEDNNLEQATNCLFVDTGRNKVLIDTGYGSKLSEKQRGILGVRGGVPLLESLQEIGISPADIDTVIFSHLHFDHAGGATVVGEDGQLKPTFPNAEYVVQRHEWMMGTADLPELRGAYPQENLLPLRDTGCLRLIDGAVDIVPGIRSIPAGGHTHGHQAIQIAGENLAAIYLGDLCPTSHHLPTRWGTSYDLDVLELRRRKFELLTAIAENNWLACFDHDPHTMHARLQHDEDRDFAVVPAAAGVHQNGVSSGRDGEPAGSGRGATSVLKAQNGFGNTDLR